MMLLRRLARPDDERLGPPLRVVVTTTRSLLQPMAPDLAEIEPVTLTAGAEAEFDAVIARLVDLAYTRVDMVGKRGEFAVRGGILDVFPPTAEHPVRAEFWGDEVSEMRMFAVADQRSIPEIAVDSVVAVPCREMLLTDDVRDRAAKLAAEHPPVQNSVTGSIPDMLAKLAEGIPVDGMEALLPLLRATELSTLSTHLPAGTPLLICDPEKVRSRAADLIKTGREFLEASWSTAAVGGDVPIDIEALGASGFVNLDDARATAREGGHPWWTLSQLSDESALELNIRPAPSARGQQSNVTEIFAMLRAHVATGGYAVVVTPGTGTAHRVVEQLAESDTPATMLEPGSGAEARCRRGAQGAAARRCGDCGGQPRRDHRDRPDRQPGQRRRRQAAGRQAPQRRRPVGADRGRSGGARPARHRPLRRDDRARGRRCTPRVPGARIWVEQARWRIRPALRPDGFARPAVALCRR